MADGQVKIFALPKNQQLIDPTQPIGPNLDNYLGGDHLYNFVSRPVTIARAKWNGYDVVDGYSDLSDLFSKVRKILKDTSWTIIGPNKQKIVVHGGCLEVLEIHAHGSPGGCDAVRNFSQRITDFVTGLKKTNLCDKIDLYFSGCNTGVHNQGGPSIAQMISAAGPTKQKDNVELTVWGTVGYSTGTHALGNSNCIAQCTTGEGKKKLYHSPYPDIKDPATGKVIKPGSRDESDPAKCFVGFREGSPI